jgi:hypothetical protein
MWPCCIEILAFPEEYLQTASQSYQMLDFWTKEASLLETCALTGSCNNT